MAAHVRALRAEVAALQETGGESLSDALAQWLLARFAGAVRRAEAEAGGELPLATLRGIAREVAALRKGDQRAERLKLERERIEIERTKTRERMEEAFKEWRVKKEEEEKNRPGQLTPEERDAKMRRIFGLPPRGQQWCSCGVHHAVPVEPLTASDDELLE